MSEVVAIIAEYNPFHMGHKYQIDKIKQEKPNATIIAIMSGNTVQRGDFAFCNKYARAKMAVECGVDAVFELPFPYSCSTAEIFASAGVEIAGKLGADYLYFGLEEYSLNYIENIAILVDSPEFKAEFNKLSKDKNYSYISIKEKALRNLGCTLSTKPNDILAIEYIRAIKNKCLSLKYRGIQRIGAGYKNMDECDIMSASAIREKYYRDNVLMSIPSNAMKIIAKESDSGRIVDPKFTNRAL